MTTDWPPRARRRRLPSIRRWLPDWRLRGRPLGTPGGTMRQVSFVVAVGVATFCLPQLAMSAGLDLVWRVALALCLPWLVLAWVRTLDRSGGIARNIGTLPLVALVAGQGTASSGAMLTLVLPVLLAGLWFEALTDSGADTMIRTALCGAAYLLVVAPAVDQAGAAAWPVAVVPLTLMVAVAALAHLARQIAEARVRRGSHHRRFVPLISAIATADNFEQTVRAILAAASHAATARQVRLALRRGAALHLVPPDVAQSGPETNQVLPLALLPTAAWGALTDGQMVDASQPDYDCLRAALQLMPASTVTVAPLVTGTSLLGILVVDRHGALGPAERERLATVAALAGLALDQHEPAFASAPVPRAAVEPYRGARGDVDPLTHLGRRQSFLDALERRLTRADGAAPAVTVLHIDLDRFQVINHSLSHEAGDHVLTMIAERLRAHLGPDALLSRIGGDEFALVLPDGLDIWAAMRDTAHLLDVIQEPIVVERQSIVVTASAGITAGAPGRDHAETLFQQAGIAVTEAKRQGQSSFAVYDASMAPRTGERLDLESGLRRALKEDELELHYQPLLDLATGRIAEVEALLRWRHPRRGLLAPSEFIALAEETGLIVPLGNWALDEACREVQRWQRRHPDQPALIVGVNLSARQFQQPGLVARVARALGAARLDSRQLKLEITESVALLDADSTLFTLNELRLLGVTLAMDDFGTGYSALRSLKRFPLHHLKIDRSFIAGLGSDAGDTAIVRAIVDFARSIGLSVTAEGIETVDQLRQLIELGCDLGQGYVIAEPCPWPELAPRLTAQARLLDGDRLVWEPVHEGATWLAS